MHDGKHVYSFRSKVLQLASDENSLINKTRNRKKHSLTLPVSAALYTFSSISFMQHWSKVSKISKCGVMQVGKNNSKMHI